MPVGGGGSSSSTSSVSVGGLGGGGRKLNQAAAPAGGSTGTTAATLMNAGTNLVGNLLGGNNNNGGGGGGGGAGASGSGSGRGPTVALPSTSTIRSFYMLACPIVNGLVGRPNWLPPLASSVPTVASDVAANTPGPLGIVSG